MTAAGPLAGLVVVAVEQAVAAPFCTSRLADAGAKVIKIERPEGDFARGYDDAVRGQSSYFVWLNRGKHSLAMDLTRAEARRELSEMIAGADIFVQNLRPGSLDKLGLGAQTLAERHPKLIICSISGYGEQGPLASRKAYDLLIQAESGLSSVTGGPNEQARVGISIVDIATGATAYSAVLEALIARSVTGRGANIHVSMFDVMAEWLTVPLLHAEAGRSPRRMGLAHPSIAPYGVFSSRDGAQVLISIQSEREWRQFCLRLLGAASLAEDPRFSTNVARVENRAETDRMVADAFGLVDRAELVAKLSDADIAFAELNDMNALSRHPHLRRIAVETPVGAVSMPAPAPVFAGEERSYGAVPSLGEHGGPEPLSHPAEDVQSG
jgi:crotonobetainyl-CoA:carnitine CoA-transferase CaiB-like acyl-CoA transferase